MMIFFYIWLASVVVQLLLGFIGRFMPKAKFSGGFDPFYVMLWMPVLNTLVSIAAVGLAIHYFFWKRRKQK